MADAYWRFAEGRQPAIPPPLLGKRARPEFDVPGAHDLLNFYGRDVERAPRGVRDPDSFVATHDRYFHGPQLGPYGRGEPVRPLGGGLSPYGRGEPARPLGGGLSGRPIDDSRVMGIGGSEPAMSSKMGVAGGRPEISLPPDATGTLFVEGLPPNCSRREVAHIFRPFVGYKEVRLVTKDSRHSGGDPLVLCFVDFLSPAHAATAMDALQGEIEYPHPFNLEHRDHTDHGYRFDEHDRDSVNLRLQFSRHPGARSGGGNRGRR